jgi:hypothetical protein
MPAFQSRSSPPISSLHAVIASRHTRVFIEKIDPFIGVPDALPMDDMEEKSRHAVLVTAFPSKLWPETSSARHRPPGLAELMFGFPLTC